MTKKLSREEFEKRLAANNLTLSKHHDYRGLQYSYPVSCNKCGNRYRATGLCLTRHGCQKCYENNNPVAISLSKINRDLQKIGYRMDENSQKTYKNTSQPVLLYCPDGHEWWGNINKIRQGKRCPECNKAARQLRKR